MKQRQITLGGISGTLGLTGWQPPAALTRHRWESIGEQFARMEGGLSWWLGDWWNAYRPEWGERAACFEQHPDWPAYMTCANAGTVCIAFDTSRRREVLTWQHHAVVAGEPMEQADLLLDWCEEPLRDGGKARSTRELRGEMWRRRRMAAGVLTVEGTFTSLEELVATGQRFGTIYADPPWRYDNQGTRAATSDHYEGLSIDELCALPIASLAAPDAHLHLWTTNGFLFETPRIFAAWGFEFRSSFVWVKPQIGIGNYWRNAHEFLLTAIRGNARSFNDTGLRSWLECERGRHSEKPEQVRVMLEKASPGPRLELFGRREVAGWTVWGNEVQQDLFSPSLMEAAK